MTESPQPTPRSETKEERMARLALELLRLDVSVTVTRELLCYDLDVVERQLEWLPYRNVRKKASFIVSAIREDYEAPSILPE